MLHERVVQHNFGNTREFDPVFSMNAKLTQLAGLEENGGGPNQRQSTMRPQAELKLFVPQHRE